MSATGERDDAAVQRYAEQFSNVLTESGWQRMSARVFTAILASEEGRLTAAELAERLHASPAAISGAVRYLLHLRLATREREPGSRRDLYVVQDDFWFETMMRQDQALLRWEEILERMLLAAGPDTAAGHRIRGTLAFTEFIQHEVIGLSERWRRRRAELDAELG